MQQQIYNIIRYGYLESKETNQHVKTRRTAHAL